MLVTDKYLVVSRHPESISKNGIILNEGVSLAFPNSSDRLRAVRGANNKRKLTSSRSKRSKKY